MARSITDLARDSTQRMKNAHIPLIIMIALLLLALIFLGRTLYISGRNMNSYLQSASAQRANTLDERVNVEIARLDAISDMLCETGRRTYINYIDVLSSHSIPYKRMGIIAPNDTIYSTAEEPRPLAEADSVYSYAFENAPSSAYGLISPVFADEYDGEPVLLCATSLPKSGYVPGVLYGVMAFDQFIETIMGDMVNEYVLITDQAGKVLYHSNLISGLLSDGGMERLRSALLNSVRANYEPLDWGDYKLVTAQLGYNGWLLTQLVPNEMILDAETRDNLLGIVISLVMLGLAIAFTSYQLMRRARGSENMVREAGIDRLTGINNHLGFSTDARAIMDGRGSQRYALVLLRTDAQELLGARYGYDAGSSMLQDVARTISAECESGETCARLDGSQFVMLLRFSDTADMLLRIKALNSHLLTLCPLRARIHYGIYAAEDGDTTDLDQMIERANEAALRVMRKGDLVGMYDDELHQRQISDEALLNRAPGAIENGEFEVRYRPLRDIESGAIVGAEASAFWHQPDGSVLRPSEYMPLLTRNAMMGPLNMFVLERVCSDLNAQAAAGHSCGRVLVNISRDNLADSMFSPHMHQLLRQYGISTSQLEVLLSESLFIDEGALLTNILRRMHDDGLRICVSDFGSGASSLRIFSGPPVDAVRLSGEFVKRCCKDERGKSLMDSLSVLARSLGIDVYASGELSQEQTARLRECGCICLERICASADCDFCQLSEVEPPRKPEPADPFDDWA